MPGHLVLKGLKVSLWTITKEDLKSIWLYFGDYELRKYLYIRWEPIYYENEEKWYEKIIENEKDIVFAIVENSSNKLIGLIGLHEIDRYSRHAEMAYWIWKEYHGKGYGTEAVRLMVEYGFKYLNLNKIWARVFEPNKASQRVLEKNGFKLVGKFRKHEYSPAENDYINILVYDLLREEWEEHGAQ